MNIISAIIMLGALIFFHELGHFLFAKLMKVGVLKFSLGFGPKLVGKKIGETEYQISAVPLGGYVKMLGDEVGEEFPESEKERAFQYQPVGKRVLIVLAGPVFNVLLTYLIYTSVLAAHVPVNIPNLSALVPAVESVVQNSPAAKAGIEPGDKITRIGDKQIDSLVQVDQIVSENPGKPLDFTVKRGDRTLNFRITPRTIEIRSGDHEIRIGQIGIEKYSSPVIGEVRHDSPAFRAGLKRGDRILKIDGREIGTWFDMVRIVKESPGKELTFTIRRGGRVLDSRVVPMAVPADGSSEPKVGQIGVGAADYFNTVESSSFGQALYKGGIVTFKMGFFVFDSIRMLFSGEVSLRSIGGPVTIVRESGRAASAGVLPYFIFMALFSVNLGILNLLPIPILDGGHILYFAIEKVKGSPLSEKTISVLNRVGLALLAALMLLAFYNDFMRLFFPFR